MVKNSELFSILAILVIVIDLIITGIVGLVKKKIRAKNIFMQLLFLPLGLIGTVIGFFFGKIDNEIDKGKAAISSSIATIALGLFILIFFGFFYLDIYNIIDYELIKIAIPICLISIIIVVPLSISYFVNRSQK